LNRRFLHHKWQIMNRWMHKKINMILPSIQYTNDYMMTERALIVLAKKTPLDNQYINPTFLCCTILRWASQCSADRNCYRFAAMCDVTKTSQARIAESASHYVLPC
jgi:hypothetical protein